MPRSHHYGRKPKPKAHRNELVHFLKDFDLPLIFNELGLENEPK